MILGDGTRVEMVMHDARMTQFRDARLNNKITGDNFPDETMKAPLDVLKEDKVD